MGGVMSLEVGWERALIDEGDAGFWSVHSIKQLPRFLGSCEIQFDLIVMQPNPGIT